MSGRISHTGAISYCICDEFYPLVVLEESQLITKVIRSDLIMCAKFHVNIVFVVETHISLTVTHEDLIMAAGSPQTLFNLVLYSCYHVQTHTSLHPIRYKNIQFDSAT